MISTSSIVRISLSPPRLTHQIASRSNYYVTIWPAHFHHTTQQNQQTGQDQRQATQVQKSTYSAFTHHSYVSRYATSVIYLEHCKFISSHLLNTSSAIPTFFHTLRYPTTIYYDIHTCAFIKADILNKRMQALRLIHVSNHTCAHHTSCEQSSTLQHHLQPPIQYSHTEISIEIQNTISSFA